MNCPKCDSTFPATESICSNCGYQMIKVPEGGSWIGRIIDHRYRVLDQIGKGGMGEVYKVEHVKMGKIAAMKFVHSELAANSEVLHRFRREARAVSKLSHPHTVQVFDFGEYEGSLYLVMEYVKGRDLRTVLREDKTLPYSRALPIMIQMSLALEEAHEAGVIHRDIKPENVLVMKGRDEQDYTKVLDFGLALFREGHQAEQANITAQGDVVGTPYYMPPEQIRGEDLDFRVDVYSLGATLYHLLTGETPYVAKSPIGVLTKCLTEELVPPSRRREELNIPGELESVVMKAMAKDREKRYATVHEFRKALQSCLRTLSVGQIPVLEASTGAYSSLPNSRIRVHQSSPFLSENNLRREDFDRMERSFRWRRRIIGAVIPLLLFLGGGGALAWFLLRPQVVPTGRTAEKEPNNETTDANLINRARAVKGRIGKRIDKSTADRDVYTFTVKAKGAVLLTATLKGIPFIDTSLQIISDSGQELAMVNNAGKRGDEVLPNLVAKPGKYFAVVQEVAGKQPGSNVTDYYELRVTWRPLKADDEIEPNDGLEQANQVSLGETVVGYLSRRDDCDVFVPQGKGGGLLIVKLSGVGGVDTRLRVIRAEKAQGKDFHDSRDRWPRATVAIFDKKGAGEAEEGAVSWPEGAPAPLVVVERKNPGVEPADYELGTPGGLDAAYRLTITLKAGAAAPKPGMGISPISPMPAMRAAPMRRPRPVAMRPRPAARRPVPMRPAMRPAAMRPAPRAMARPPAMRPRAMARPMPAMGM